MIVKNSEQEINDIINKLRTDHRENLEAFFKAKGVSRSLKNNWDQSMRAAGEHVRKQVAKYNKEHGSTVANSEVYAALGEEDSIQTHPSERAIMQKLTDMIFENVSAGRPEFDGLSGSDLYKYIIDRASEYGIPTYDYMEAIGFPWKQNIPVNKPEDVIKIIQDKFDSIFKVSDQNVQITRTMLREKGLYNWLRHKRIILGAATEESISDFINTKLTGYVYSGYDTKHIKAVPLKNGLKYVVAHNDTMVRD